MGIVWEAYHKGVPAISLDSLNKTSSWGIFLVLMWFDRYSIYMQNDGWYTKHYPFDRSVLDASNQVMHFPWQRCILKTEQCLQPWHHWKTANHPFSGAMLVSGRVLISLYTYTLSFQPPYFWRRFIEQLYFWTPPPESQTIFFFSELIQSWSIIWRICVEALDRRGKRSKHIKCPKSV